MMVSEAEQVLNDVLKSTSELKELLAFSAEQQTAVRLLYSVRLYALMDHLLPPTIGITTSFFFCRDFKGALLLHKSYQRHQLISFEILGPM
jgi:hypothetical protein